MMNMLHSVDKANLQDFLREAAAAAEQLKRGGGAAPPRASKAEIASYFSEQIAIKVHKMRRAAQLNGAQTSQSFEGR